MFSFSTRCLARGLFLFVPVCWAVSATAESLDVPDSPLDAAAPAAEPSAGEKVETDSLLLAQADDAHTALSLRLEAAARRIDEFFASDQSFAEATDTYASVRLDTLGKDGKVLGFDAAVRVRLDLPRTEHKFKLLIETDPRGAADTEPQPRPERSFEEQNYFLSIESALNRTGRWDVRPALGVKLRFPVDPFARLRAIRYFSSGHWLLRTSGEVFWFDSEGYGARADIDIDRALTDRILFRSSTTPGWLKDEDFARAEQRFTLYQKFDAHSTMAYQTGVFASDPEHWRVDEYFTAVSYRRLVYKNWLYVEFIPKVSFFRSDHYEAEPSVTLRLEGVFGENYL